MTEQITFDLLFPKGLFFLMKEQNNPNRVSVSESTVKGYGLSTNNIYNFNLSIQ